MDHDDLLRFVGQLRTLQRRQRAERRPVAGLTRSAVRVLGAVARSSPGIQPSQLAAELVMTSSNVAAALRELTGQELVTRTADERDSRRVNITLTTVGQRLVCNDRAVRDTWLSDAIAALLTEEQEQTLRAAGDIIERLAAYRYEPPRP